MHEELYISIYSNTTLSLRQTWTTLVFGITWITRELFSWDKNKSSCKNSCFILTFIPLNIYNFYLTCTMFHIILFYIPSIYGYFNPMKNSELTSLLDHLASKVYRSKVNNVKWLLYFFWKPNWEKWSTRANNLRIAANLLDPGGRQTFSIKEDHI